MFKCMNKTESITLFAASHTPQLAYFQTSIKLTLTGLSYEGITSGYVALACCMSAGGMKSDAVERTSMQVSVTPAIRNLKLPRVRSPVSVGRSDYSFLAFSFALHSFLLAAGLASFYPHYYYTTLTLKVERRL